MSLTDDTALDAADTTTLEPLPLAPAPVGPSLLLRAGAEVFGTFILVLLGVGAGIYTSLVGGDTLATCLAFGLGAVAAIAIIGNVSGGHINPAVTLGAAIAGRFAWLDVPVYWIAQILGATLATVVLRAVMPSALPAALPNASGETSTAAEIIARGANGYGANAPFSTASNGLIEISVVSALIIEIVLTLVLVAVVLAVTSKKAASNLTPLWVGLTITVVLLVATPFTGGSVNPARSLGVAFLSGTTALGQVWVFVVGPLVGGLLAGLVARLLSLGGSPAAVEAAPTDADIDVIEVVEISEDGELVEAVVAQTVVTEATDAESADSDGDDTPTR